MQLVTAIIKPFKLDDVRDALASFTSLPEEGQARLRAGMSREKQASVLEAWHSSGRAEGT